MKYFTFYECASGCGCKEGDNDGNHPGAACVWEEWERQFVSAWLNPSYREWGFSWAHPVGINLRLGRLNIQFFGVYEKVKWIDYTLYDPEIDGL